MKISVMLNSSRSWLDNYEIVKFLDSSKCHSIYMTDHLVNYFPGADSPDCMECWTTISAIAASTSRINIGSLVSPLSFRDPRLLAKMVGTVDHISRGRLILGLGAGWMPKEHISYGYSLHSPKTRVDIFEESLDVIIGLLNNNNFSFNGKYFKIKNAECSPSGFEDRKIPIMIGASSPRMISICLKKADILNLLNWGRQSVDSIKKHSDKSIFKSSIVSIAPTDVDVPNMSSFIQYCKPDIIGNRDLIEDHISAYSQAGLDELIVPDYKFFDIKSLIKILDYILKLEG